MMKTSKTDRSTGRNFTNFIDRMMLLIVGTRTTVPCTYIVEYVHVVILFIFTDAILNCQLGGNILTMVEEQLSSKMNMEQGSQTEGRFWHTCTELEDSPGRSSTT